MTYQCYLVGGAVRDKLLGIANADRDWLVVGATVEALLAQGFQQVGVDFPVFLHPQTKEEYALARKERKNGQGYHGFLCDFSPNVSLEEDLLRRDLTINAIAEDEKGQLHDPFGGQNDLKARVLRHISPAFSEDPLRVLRVARFYARFQALGFQIAPETLALMREISQTELTALTPERVWLETQKALENANPAAYFDVLREVGALKVLFPELDALWGVPAPAKHHPEIDSGVHTLLVLAQAKLLAEKAENPVGLLWSALCHDLGKALTPADILPHHYGHEQKGVTPCRNLSDRLKVPAEVKSLALFATEFHTHIHKFAELRPTTILELFNKLDVWRKPARFHDFLLVCEADSKGRLGFEERAYPQRDWAWRCYEMANQVNVQEIIAAGFEKQAIREQLNRRRIAVIAQFKRDNVSI